jgi:uncharacterized protein YjiS (DUF1127 family)
LLGAWRAAFERIRLKRRLRRDEQDLRALSDHVLCDLGIGRSEILGVIGSVRGPALQRGGPT